MLCQQARYIAALVFLWPESLTNVFTEYYFMLFHQSSIISAFVCSNFFINELTFWWLLKSWNYDFFPEPKSHEFVTCRGILQLLPSLQRNLKQFIVPVIHHFMSVVVFYLQIGFIVDFMQSKTNDNCWRQHMVWHRCLIWWAGFVRMSMSKYLFMNNVALFIFLWRQKWHRKIYRSKFWQNSNFCFTLHFTVCSTWHLAAVLSPPQSVIFGPYTLQEGNIMFLVSSIFQKILEYVVFFLMITI